MNSLIADDIMISNNISNYLRFLRYSLEKNSEKPNDLQSMDWYGLFEFSKRHCIIGVIFDGVSRLDAKTPHPETTLLYKWLQQAEQLKRTNLKINDDVVKLYNRVLKVGFPGCILKGQGNNTMYPNPWVRTPGDIDIWLQGNEGDILNYARKFDSTAIANYHHVQLRMPDISTPVEIHFTPSFCGNLFYNKRMREYFDQHADEQFKNKITLPNEIGEISIPTDSFNRIFQLSHTMHHFFFEGIGLRQIIDYYYLLKRDIDDVDKEEEVKTLKYLGMYKFARAMMYVQHTIFGLDCRYMSVEPSERLGKILLKEILLAGNFGFYDNRYKFKGKSRMGQFLLEVYRNLHFAFYFPAEALFGRPVFRFWHQFEKMRIENSTKSRKY